MAVAIMFCTDFGGCNESKVKLLLKMHHMSVLFGSLRKSRVHFQSNIFILRKVMENLCDMAYQEHCKVVVSKEVSTSRDSALYTNAAVELLKPVSSMQKLNFAQPIKRFEHGQ